MLKPGRDELADLFKNVPYGTHFCLFNATESDLSLVLLPFIKDGLARNDAFVYIASKAGPSSQDVLRSGFPDIDQYFKKGQIEVIPDGELYYKLNITDPDRVMAEWISRYEQALARGFSGLRIIGSPYGEAKNIWHDLVHWEDYVNRDISKYNLILFCHYPIDSISATDIPTLLSSHQFSMFCISSTLQLFESLEAKQLRNALNQSEEQFSTLTESSRTGILVVQGEQIVYVNPAMASYTGYSRGELLKLHLGELFLTGGKTPVEKPETGLPGAISGTAPSLAALKTRSGVERWVECYQNAILFKGMPATLVTMLDITERKRAEAEVAEAKDRAELYVDLMGHDITNMNQVAIGFLEIALEFLDTRGRLERDEREFIEKPVLTIERSCQLIDNIKKLQQERSGIYKPVLTDVAEVLKSVIAQFSHVPGRDVTINYEVAARCQVLANELLGDVFVNLLDNAVKHTTGPVTINVTLVQVSVDGKPFCKITVEDNGPGIPDDQKKKLFERLCRSRVELQRTGFGLCLVNTLVRDFHGQFWVEDRVPGDHTQGARFVVLVPVAAPGSATTAGAAPA